MRDSSLILLMGAALVGGVLTPVVPASADERAGLADGTVARLASGKLVLEQDGRQCWSKRLGSLAAKKPLSLSVHELADGAAALHVTGEDQAGKPAAAVAVRHPGKCAAKVVWQGSTALAGDLGERSGAAVRFEDLTGDGLPEIVVGQVAEAVALCGTTEAPLLFRRVYDAGSGKLRSVLAKRPALGAPTEIEGASAGADAGPEPLLRMVTPASVSRSAGDRGDPLLLVPPHALTDGDPATAWIPGNGAGGGEFATFGVQGQVYGVTRVGVRARPLAAGAKSRKYDRPRTLLLAAEGQVFRLRFPEGQGGADETVWFELPEPIRTGCLSLVVEETAAPRRGVPLALAELEVRTEIDGPDGLARLAGDLGSDERGEQAGRLLISAGARAAAPVREAWEKLDDSGRRRATRVLVEAAPEEGAALLAEVAVGDDEVAARSAARGLARTGKAGAEALAGQLGGDDDERFEKAARILAGMRHDAALEALLGSTGSGGRERRRLLRDLIPRAVTGVEGRDASLLAALADAQDAPDRERQLDLLRAAVRVSSLNEGLVEKAVSLYRCVDGFDDRYRLLGVLGALPGDEPRALLLAAVEDEDHLIRAAALVGLGSKPADDEVTAALVAALDDPTPEVRLAALAGLGGRALSADAAARVVELGGADPWPEVRARVVQLAPRLPDGGGRELVAAATADESEQVRMAALRATVGLEGEAIDAAIVGRLKDPEENARVKGAAARAAGMGCREATLDALFGVLAKGAEPLADTVDVDAAIAATRAIGAIGTARGAALLEQAKRRSNPSTDKAIEAAEKTLGRACGSPVEGERIEDGSPAE